MKKFHHIILIVTAITALASLKLYAGGKATPTPFVPHHTLIESISADSITVATINEKKTYKITKFTEFMFQGNEVKIDALTPGMKVSVVAGSDGTSAEVINASPAPKEVKAPAKKK